MSVVLYTGGARDLPSGTYVLYLLSGIAQNRAGEDVWIVQTVAVRADELPAEPDKQVDAVAAAALAQFAGSGSTWRPSKSAPVREVGRQQWPIPYDV